MEKAVMDIRSISERDGNSSDLFCSVSNYISSNSKIIVFAFAIGILAFGYELFNFTLSVDEETKTFANSGIAWVEQGRWSNYLLLKIFQPESLVPFIPTFFAIFFLVISSLLFFELIAGDNISKAVFFCLFIKFL